MDIAPGLQEFTLQERDKHMAHTVKVQEWTRYSSIHPTVWKPIPGSTRNTMVTKKGSFSMGPRIKAQDRH